MAGLAVAAAAAAVVVVDAVIAVDVAARDKDRVFVSSDRMSS